MLRSLACNPTKENQALGNPGESLSHEHLFGFSSRFKDFWLLQNDLLTVPVLTALEWFTNT